MEECAKRKTQCRRSRVGTPHYAQRVDARLPSVVGQPKVVAATGVCDHFIVVIVANK